jgi:hypothetical protein
MQFACQEMLIDMVIKRIPCAGLKAIMMLDYLLQQSPFLSPEVAATRRSTRLRKMFELMGKTQEQQ